MTKKAVARKDERIAEGGETEAEDHRKEDDLQHLAFGHGLHRVDRDDVQERLRERRRFDGLGGETFGRKVKADARLDEACKGEADRNGDGRREGVADQRLGGDAAELRGVRNAGGASNDGGEHQRHHDHADQANEEVAQRLKESFRGFLFHERADHDAER